VLHAFLFFLVHFLQRLELCFRHASIERSDALKQVTILRLGNVNAPLQVEAHDYYDDPSAWFTSLELLSKEVAPRVRVPGEALVAA
jgi:hypothetical protein